jgi:pyruvate ferredoxin oxidoreductase gamma subunit
MFQVRVHGRGGQGVVTAAELLSVAAFLDGHEAQAFPSFGSERMGAPVMAFCRIDDIPIRVREPVAQPSAVLVCDATLLQQVEVFAGLPEDGYALINSIHSWSDLGLDDLPRDPGGGRMLTVPATDLARAHIGQPLANTCLLGGFAALTGAVTIGSVETALRQRFPGKTGERNVGAARAAYEWVLEREVRRSA